MVTTSVVFLMWAGIGTAAMNADGTVGKLQIISQSDFPMAAALDGSPPVYYIRPAGSVASAKKWVLYLDGGDFCGYGNTEQEQLNDCYARSKTNLGSSVTYLKQPHFDMNMYSPLFDISMKSNPLAYDWNWIFVPYLDGGYYAGTREDTPVVNNSKLHFRGAFNIEAIIASLATHEHFKEATDVVLSGCSSGGVAVIANADHLYDALLSVAPKTRLSAFVDSGYYLNVNTQYWTRPPLRMQHIGRSLSSACLAARSSTPWDCIVAEVAAPFVRRLPVFVSESRYDSNQLGCANISSSNISGINAYGSRLLAAVTAWAGQGDSWRRGAFVDGCSRHCSITAGIAMSDGLTPTVAFSAFHSHDAQKLNKSVVVQPGSYPCHSCCGAIAEVLV